MILDDLLSTQPQHLTKHCIPPLQDGHRVAVAVMASRAPRR